MVPVITAKFIVSKEAEDIYFFADTLFDFIFAVEILLRFCTGFYAQETDRKVEIRDFREVVAHRLTEKSAQAAELNSDTIHVDLICFVSV